MMDKVLIVEKDENSGNYIKEGLEEVCKERNVTLFKKEDASSTEVLNQLISGAFDVVVLDYDSCNYNGINIINLLKANGALSTTKVILTASELNDELYTTINETECYFQQKPFYYDTLNKSIDFFIGNKKAGPRFDFEGKISELFTTIGIKSSLAGTRYLKDAVKFCFVSDSYRDLSVTKDIYSYVSEIHNIPLSNVERNMRNAIHSSLENNLESYGVTFGLSNVSKVPTNKEFLFNATDYMKKLSSKPKF